MNERKRPKETLKGDTCAAVRRHLNERKHLTKGDTCAALGTHLNKRRHPCRNRRHLTGGDTFAATRRHKQKGDTCTAMKRHVRGGDTYAPTRREMNKTHTKADRHAYSPKGTQKDRRKAYKTQRRQAPKQKGDTQKGDRRH